MVELIDLIAAKNERIGNGGYLRERAWSCAHEGIRPSDHNIEIDMEMIRGGPRRIFFDHEKHE